MGEKRINRQEPETEQGIAYDTDEDFVHAKKEKKNVCGALRHDAASTSGRKRGFSYAVESTAFLCGYTTAPDAIPFCPYILRHRVDPLLYSEQSMLQRIREHRVGGRGDRCRAVLGSGAGRPDLKRESIQSRLYPV